MVDIVVFPEMGLFQGTDDKEAILNVAPTIPPAEAAAVPCEDYKYGEVRYFQLVSTHNELCTTSNSLTNKLHR